MDTPLLDQLLDSLVQPSARTTGFWDMTGTVTLTEEMLREQIAKLKAQEFFAHGSEQRPHIAHPRDPDLCIECGWRRPT